MIKYKMEEMHKEEAVLESKKHDIYYQAIINKDRIITLTPAQNSIANIFKKRVITELKYATRRI